jgi:serine/threonine protein kinase
MNGQKSCKLCFKQYHKRIYYANLRSHIKTIHGTTKQTRKKKKYTIEESSVSAKSEPYHLGEINSCVLSAGTPAAANFPETLTKEKRTFCIPETIKLSKASNTIKIKDNQILRVDAESPSKFEDAIDKNAIRIIVPAPYTNLKYLVSGGSSDIYSAYDYHSQAEVVIKASSSYEIYPLNEADILSKIKSSRVVLYHGYFNLANGRVATVYEKMDMCLADYDYNLGILQTKWVLFDILTALKDVHSFGIVHGDIKGENILIDSGRSIAKLADFGFATDIHDPKWHVGLRNPKKPPEYLLKHREMDYTKIDIWALGLTAVRALKIKYKSEDPPLEVLKSLVGLLGKPEDEDLGVLLNGNMKSGNMTGGFVKDDVLAVLERNESEEKKENTSAILNLPKRITPSTIASIPNEPLKQLLRSMLAWNPKKRPSAKEALLSSFFSNIERARTIKITDYQKVESRQEKTAVI